MNRYRLQEVAEHGGVVRETYVRDEGWDANGSPVVESIEISAHPVLAVERKRVAMVGHTSGGRSRILAVAALASALMVQKP